MAYRPVSRGDRTEADAVLAQVRARHGLALRQRAIEVVKLVIDPTASVSVMLMSIALGERQRSITESRFSISRDLAASNAEINAKAEFLAKISHEIRTPMNGCWA